MLKIKKSYYIVLAVVFAFVNLLLFRLIDSVGGSAMENIELLWGMFVFVAAGTLTLFGVVLMYFCFGAFIPYEYKNGVPVESCLWSEKIAYRTFAILQIWVGISLLIGASFEIKEVPVLKASMQDNDQMVLVAESWKKEVSPYILIETKMANFKIEDNGGSQRIIGDLVEKGCPIYAKVSTLTVFGAVEGPVEFVGLYSKDCNKTKEKQHDK